MHPKEDSTENPATTNGNGTDNDNDENWVSDDEDVKIGDAVANAHKLDDPLTSETLAHLREATLKSGKTASIKQFKVRQLSPELFKWVMDLFTRNMKKMYRKSQGGWKSKDKKREMTEENSRYLIAFCNNKPVGFSHFQFDMDYSREVLYCYEIQMEPEYRSCGLGRKMMEVLEKIAEQANLPLVVLTVFKFNLAMPFFHSLGYITDETCPGEDEKKDYLILSKKVC